MNDCVVCVRRLTKSRRLEVVYFHILFAQKEEAVSVLHSWGLQMVCVRFRKKALALNAHLQHKKLNYCTV